MKIKIRDIVDVTAIAFRHLEARGVDEVDIPSVFYWIVSGEERFDLASTPEQVNVGSIADDYGDLLRVISGDQEILAQHLEQLGSILAALGTILGNKLASEGG